MLNFLGTTENFAVIENIPYSMTWKFFDAWTGEPIPLDGVTFSGGEPFCQPEPLYHLARWCHRLGLDVISYSGWTLEQLREKPECQNLLNEIDWLVDGRFIIAKRSLELRFRGSSNQRLIHLSHGQVLSIE